MKLNYDFLPAYQQEIVKKLADVYQIDSDYSLTGLFSATAASQGDRYQVVDPKGYRNAIALWLCQIGISGYGKSECASWLMDPLLERDEEWHKEYKKECAKWDATPIEERKGEYPPIEKKLVLNDYTPEALFDAMEKAGINGILLYRDELSGWLKDIGRYGKSGEVEQYLTAWSQKSVRVTRLGRDDNFIKRPCFNVFGGIQPDMLHEMLGKKDLIANGFNARLLFVFADDSFSLNYFKECIPETIKVAYKNLLDRLLQTSFCEVKFSKAAEQSFVNYWQDLQARKTKEKNMIRQLLSKLQIYVEKWAGIIGLLANDGTPTSEICGNTMDIAIAHMQVFEEWATKAYSIINPDFNTSAPVLNLNKTETLQQLVKNYPKMNKNLVAQGLGINRSALSRLPEEVVSPERNIENVLSG